VNRFKSVFVLCSLMLSTQVFLLLQAYSSDVTAAQVNGTWRSKTGTFKVWALGKQRLQVEFFGVYEYKTSAGPMANTGEGRGIAFIQGDTATFKAEIRGRMKEREKARGGDNAQPSNKGMHRSARRQPHNDGHHRSHAR
jgi:hypothetical protein